MKFIDEIKIEVSSGKGGDGSVAFRREKFVPYGGPSGGDGGRGGDIILEATSDLTTLYELSFTKVLKAQNGENGMPKDMIGANGESLTVFVPVGTLVYDFESDKLLADLDESGQRFVIAKGGRGGRGNARFVSSVRRAPRMAEKGEPGVTLKIRLELKLLADVGLVGLPNAGKSTFLGSVSNARPRVADYPFTTLFPSLGIVKSDVGASFCMADIPGLIEGAHEGTGLGIQFLKHIERTKILLHLVDTSQLDLDPENILKEYDIIQAELKEFSELLADKPVVVAANKMDLPDSQELFPTFKEELAKRGIEVFPVSGATKKGVPELLKYLSQKLKEFKAPVRFEPNTEEKVYEYLPPYQIEMESKGYWVVRGAEIERLVAITDFANDEAIATFKRKLDRLGFLDELTHLAADEEDTFAIGNMEFLFWEFFY